MHVPDLDRAERIGMPEAVLCEPKTDEQLAVVLRDLLSAGRPTLCTRLPADRLASLPVDLVEALDHDPASRTATLHGPLATRVGSVAVVAAGTSDHGVAAEAAATLRFSGVDTQLIVDVGVAALWRLEARLDEIRAADVVIVVAGMDAALVSVLGGMIANPVIAVPTSVGYGVAADGMSALHSSLASCAQGIAVMNIDNGFGAACAALRILALAHPS